MQTTNTTGADEVLKDEKPKKGRKGLKTGILLLCASAAALSFPFLQQSMQGSISSGSLAKLNAASLQMDSVTVFGGPGGGYSGGGGAVTFRDMSSNVISASGGFSNIFGGFGDSSQPAHVRIHASDLPLSPYYRDEGRDAFPSYDESAVKSVRRAPVSTFSADVDTASYGFVRRALMAGQMPPRDAVRIEELVNYFPYDYPLPENRAEPFRPALAVYDCPWKKGRKLLHIGIKGYDLKERPRSSFVFLIDTSGSMSSPDKLPLVVESLKMLVEELHPDDTVGIVTYAGSAGVALEPVKASEKRKISRVLGALQSGGSTAGAAGIRAAYDLAREAFVEGGNNRVILATDGDFNVGINSAQDLKEFIAGKKESGIFLSVLGYGMGNYHDVTMQALAQEGNGNAAYISDLSEARKALVEEGMSTLFTIAKDVKFQVEFNPALVQEYRLIGYETRKLKREDFANDRVDAGDVGAGHAVTAIYEINPAGAEPEPGQRAYDDAPPPAGKKSVFADEYAFLKIRYKAPEAGESKLITHPVTRAHEKDFDDLPDDVRFAAAVAGFGQLLTGGKYVGAGFSWDDVAEIAAGARGGDKYGYRNEFLRLVPLAKSAAKKRYDD